MTINSASSPVSNLSDTGAARPSQPRPAAQPATSTPQDTVHLSHAARSASGDVDHDGDSH
ncbi:MAG TPA: hypothetical protein VG273_22315 [Bryobacteraceae bacterium]|jgi:hypothetical protein|nr:hypothetical protein [Bryobacteraceae bacterium]